MPQGLPKGHGGQLVSVGQQPSSTGLMASIGVEGLVASGSGGVGSQMLGLAQGVFQGPQIGDFPAPPRALCGAPLPSGVSAGRVASGYEDGFRCVGPMEGALASGGGMGNQAGWLGSVETARPCEAGREIGNRGVSGFFSPRGQASGVPGTGFTAEGYPVSPDGTVIRPPPGPPPQSPRVPGGDRSAAPERPKQPAKYLYEVPKLAVAEMASSAVVCGNWVAQVRQIFAGLSPTAVTWWTEVERVANAQYQRWLIADPLDRLLLDPATVRAGFDPVRFQRVESRQ